MIVPVGVTGYMASELWKEVRDKLSEFYTNVDTDLEKAFDKLNDESDITNLINNIVAFINLFKDGKYSPCNLKEENNGS